VSAVLAKRIADAVLAKRIADAVLAASRFHDAELTIAQVKEPRVDESGGTHAAHGLALQANGKVLLAGETRTSGGTRPWWLC
jgi:hypothetical protein